MNDKKFLKLIKAMEQLTDLDDVSYRSMILVDDIDDRDFLCTLIDNMWEELPEKKRH